MTEKEITPNAVPVEDQSAVIKQLEKQLQQLEKQLQFEKDRNLALNTLIDICEEQGIKIRKNLGSSGRTPLREDGIHRQVFL